MIQSHIVIKGARENNLKNIDLKLPRNKFIVMTGLSGSGKTTLAFDTIYAEGQRRYVESLSAYARQFLGGISKPDVDAIEGLSPAIAIDQKSTSNNPRSTVGTVTEIYDYMRLLFARIGTPYCPHHNIPIEAQTIRQMVENIMKYPLGEKIQILAPIATQKRGTFKDVFERLLKSGFIRVRVDGEFALIEELGELERQKKHDIEIVVDRLVVEDTETFKQRLADSLETTLKWSNGIVNVVSEDTEKLFSSNHSCPHCGFSIGKLEPKLFSFNSPMGACDACNGLGVRKEVDIDVLVPNKNLSINKGAIVYYKNIIGSENIEWQEFEFLAKHYHINLDTPFKDLSEVEKRVVIEGSDVPLKWRIETRSGNVLQKQGYIEGVKPKIERMHLETTSDFMRGYYASFMLDKTCPKCEGKRLNEQALSVRINDLNIHDFALLSIKEHLNKLENLKLSLMQIEISHLIVKEIKERLGFLIDVGLDYLTLARNASTLSGGEAQRIRLATQIGSQLTGVLYVLDEPSIGLHQKDNEKLIKALKKMRDLGNTLIVVEHDIETMLASDFLVDIGPGSGVAGGEIVIAGTPSEVAKCSESITGRYLSGIEKIETPIERRKPNNKFIKIKNARGNNLKNIDVQIPLGVLTVVSGVSGSGKSTLINETLATAVLRKLGNTKMKPLLHDDILGLEHIDKLIDVNQSPIGRTPRSNPATYTGVFDFIRTLFTSTKESIMRGYDKGRFSFNVRGGRCERCQGDGVIRVPMHFLPDVYVPCEECDGKRYSEETLQIKYKDKNISDILNMSVAEALIFFKNIPNIRRRIQTLSDVGLDYLKLGQSATTLSGGEAQRLKLASELQKRATGQTLYILDEPTTGLHSHDVKKLLNVIQRIVDNGDSVIIIEHNLDVIKSADYIIDLGYGGGDEGGSVIARGTPEEVSKVKGSFTGQFLQKVLK